MLPKNRTYGYGEAPNSPTQNFFSRTYAGSATSNPFNYRKFSRSGNNLDSSYGSSRQRFELGHQAASRTGQNQLWGNNGMRNMDYTYGQRLVSLSDLDQTSRHQESSRGWQSNLRGVGNLDGGLHRSLTERYRAPRGLMDYSKQQQREEENPSQEYDRASNSPTQISGTSPGSSSDLFNGRNLGKSITRRVQFFMDKGYSRHEALSMTIQEKKRRINRKKGIKRRARLRRRELEKKENPNCTLSAPVDHPKQQEGEKEVFEDSSQEHGEASNSPKQIPLGSPGSRSDPSNGRDNCVSITRDVESWMRKGYSNEEALIMAVQETKKRITSKKSFKKRERKRRKMQLQSMKPGAPTCTQSAPGVKMTIVHRNHPHETLTTDQLEALKEDILEKIVEDADDSAAKPKFLQVETMSGYLFLECADYCTAEWLQGMEGDLKFSGEFTVKMDSEEWAQERIYIGEFPSSSHYSNLKILDLLGSQNSIDTSGWKILKRTPKPGLAELTIAANLDSVKHLQETDLNLSFKFGPVLLRLQEGSEVNSALSSSNSHRELPMLQMGDDLKSPPLWGSLSQ